MKIYTVIYAPRARKQIEELPPQIKLRIDNVIVNHLSVNPFFGKALKGELKGLFSYRVGDYRIIYSISRNELIIQVIKVMHRRDVYR